MSEGDRVEARNVSMYPQEWEAVDLMAETRGLVTARGPNTSQMLRQIVREYFRDRDVAPAAPECADPSPTS